jgi:hypothetical protein
MENKFDIKELHKRISEFKDENKKSSEFTRSYFECLIERHDLQNFLHETQEFDGVPEQIIELLKKGEVPTEEQLFLMDAETQDYLIKDCVFICGLGAISWYSSISSECENEKESPINIVLGMIDESPGHHTASYIMSAYTLLLAKIPSLQFIEMVTNKFDSSEEQIEKNLELYNELCVSVLGRYLEDKEYYANKK